MANRNMYDSLIIKNYVNIDEKCIFLSPSKNKMILYKIVINWQNLSNRPNYVYWIKWSDYKHKKR